MEFLRGLSVLFPKFSIKMVFQGDRWVARGGEKQHDLRRKCQKRDRKEMKCNITWQCPQ
jgi:hypothetical protein